MEFNRKFGHRCLVAPVYIAPPPPRDGSRVFMSDDSQGSYCKAPLNMHTSKERCN